MKSFCFLAMACMIAGFLIAPPAQAQCPAGLTSPLYLINGTTWTFQTADDVLGDGALGTFTAQVQLPTSINPYLTGILNVTMTSNVQGQLTVQQQSVGRYQIDDNCASGELFFHAGQNAYQYAFVFFNGRMEMYMTSNNNSVGNVSAGPFGGNHGKASLKTTFACPTGLADPLYLLNGTAWSFQATDFLGSSVGIFNAQVQPPSSWNSNLTGQLAVTETTSAAGTVYNNQVFPGKYLINPDCSGGELDFMTNLNSVRYFFLFAENPTRMLLLSDVPNNGNVPGAGFRANRGEAKPF